MIAQTAQVVPLHPGNIYVYDCKRTIVFSNHPEVKPGRVLDHWTQTYLVDSLDETAEKPYFRVLSFDQNGERLSEHLWHSDEHSFSWMANSCCSSINDGSMVRMMWVDTLEIPNSLPSWCYGLQDEDGTRYDGVDVSIHNVPCLEDQCNAQRWSYYTFWATYGDCQDRTYLTAPPLGVLEYTALDHRPVTEEEEHCILRGAVIDGILYGDTSQVVTSLEADFQLGAFDGANPSSVFVFPNPATDVLNLSFTLVHPRTTSVELFDMRGSKVKQLLQRNYPAGSHSVKLDVNALSAGAYSLRLRVGAEVLNRLVTVRR